MIAETEPGRFFNRSLCGAGGLAIWQCTHSIGSVAVKGRTPVNLVQRDAYGVEIAAGVDRSVHPPGLFGRHVGKRTGGHFSGIGVRFLQAGERPRVWRTKSLISRFQAEARRAGDHPCRSSFDRLTHEYELKDVTALKPEVSFPPLERWNSRWLLRGPCDRACERRCRRRG